MTEWLIATGDFVTTGGMDAANWHLAKYLASTRPVELVAHRVDPILASIPNIRVTLASRPLKKHLLGQPFLRRAAMKRSRAMLARGGRAVANGGNAAIPDINWVHYVHAAFEPTKSGSVRNRAKAWWLHRSSLRSERHALQCARIVICNSRLSQRHVVEGVGISEGKTAVVYYGADPIKLKPISPEEKRASRDQLGWDDRPWVVFVGALGDRRKGFDLLYSAWKQVSEQPGWDANLAVIGRGAELEAWREQARHEGLASRIQFLGFRNDVPNVLAACDLMIHPARYEAYGLGVHEAMCRGLPVIVSSQAGVAEQIDDSLAALILPQPENVGDLADRMLHWRKNLDCWGQRMKPLADRLRSRTWDQMSAEFVACAEAQRIAP